MSRAKAIIRKKNKRISEEDKLPRTEASLE